MVVVLMRKLLELRVFGFGFFRLDTLWLWSTGEPE